jgi:hypothetical protein
MKPAKTYRWCNNLLYCIRCYNLILQMYFSHLHTTMHLMFQLSFFFFFWLSSSHLIEWTTIITKERTPIYLSYFSIKFKLMRTQDRNVIYYLNDSYNHLSFSYFYIFIRFLLVWSYFYLYHAILLVHIWGFS